MSGFMEMFRVGDRDDEPPGEPTRPRWVGPPEDELGVVVPQSLVLGHSEHGAIVLSHAVAYSTGVAFEFVARARGLTRSDANRVFHEQHTFGEEDLPDALLRIGFELADGNRVSNVARSGAQQMLTSPDAEPEGPILIPYAGEAEAPLKVASQCSRAIGFGRFRHGGRCGSRVSGHSLTSRSRPLRSTIRP